MDDFDVFWKTYPRRVAKFSARTAWDKALKRDTAENIIAGAKRYASERAGKDAQYTAHPATWLNAGRWLDEQETPPSVLDYTAIRRQREAFIEHLHEQDRIKRERRMQLKAAKH